MNSGIETMKNLLMELLPADMNLETRINGVNLVRRENAYQPKPLLYKPEIIILAQGRKNVYLGDRRYTYDANNYLVLTVHLPVMCEAIIKPGEPLLGIVIKLDPRVIGEILAEMGSAPPMGQQVSQGLYQASMSPDLIDASIRLLRALKSEKESRILGPMCVKEIIFKIITGEHGEVLRELASSNRNLFQISRIVSIIHEKYSQPLDMQTLAKEAGMSISAFHSNFREVTSSSPLQYLKTTRLHRAKELIQQHGEKAYQAASMVGYESVSQFSREYKRCFGVSPAKDRQAALID
jgi:AraC-like DNA-binding protein